MERRQLPFPPQHVYQVVVGVSEYKRFVPWCVDSVVMVPSPRPGAPLEAELTVGFRMLSERYVSRVTAVPLRSVTAVASGTTLFSHLVNVWEFEPGATPGTTHLTFRVEFQFKSQLYASVSQMFFNEVVRNMVQAFEGRCKDTLEEFLVQQKREAAAAAAAIRAQASAAADAAAAEKASQQRKARVQPLRPGLW